MGYKGGASATIASVTHEPRASYNQDTALSRLRHRYKSGWGYQPGRDRTLPEDWTGRRVLHPISEHEGAHVGSYHFRFRDGRLEDVTVIAWPGTADADARRPAVGNGSGGRMLPLPLSEAQRVDLFGPWSARVDCPLFLGLFHLEPVTTGPAGR